MALKWLERQDLDVLKWEQCIDDSLFPSLFARSWYLDIMTDGRWQAIIDENYKAVFPVLKKKKFVLPYITMPFYVNVPELLLYLITIRILQLLVKYCWPGIY